MREKARAVRVAVEAFRISHWLERGAEAEKESGWLASIREDTDEEEESSGEDECELNRNNEGEAGLHGEEVGVSNQGETQAPGPPEPKGESEASSRPDESEPLLDIKDLDLMTPCDGDMVEETSECGGSAAGDVESLAARHDALRAHLNEAKEHAASASEEVSATGVHRIYDLSHELIQLKKHACPKFPNR